MTYLKPFEDKHLNKNKINKPNVEGERPLQWRLFISEEGRQ